MSLIEEHLAFLVVQNRRPSTLHHRGRCLRAVAQAIDPRPLTELTKADVLLFLGRKLKPESRRAYLSHIRGFCAWAVDEGVMREDPTAKIPGIRVPPVMPRPMPVADIRLALDGAPPRMHAWLMLMALQGLRSMEVAALRPGDLLTDPALLLHLKETKGGGQAIMPCHPSVAAALHSLPMRNGAWWTVTANTVSAQVSLHLRSLGIEGTAHRLRHSAATAWYGVDHDLVTTQRLLRHRSLSSTQRYADVHPGRTAEVLTAVDLAG